MGLVVAVVFGVQAVLLWWVSSGKADQGNVMKHRWCKWTLRWRLALEEPMSLGQPRTNGFSAVWLKPKSLQHQFGSAGPAGYSIATGNQRGGDDHSGSLGEKSRT